MIKEPIVLSAKGLSFHDLAYYSYEPGVWFSVCSDPIAKFKLHFYGRRDREDLPKARRAFEMHLNTSGEMFSEEKFEAWMKKDFTSCVMNTGDKECHIVQGTKMATPIVRDWKNE